MPTSLSLGRVHHEILRSLEAELQEAAGNRFLSIPEERSLVSPLLKEELGKFRAEKRVEDGPGYKVRVDHVAGSFSGRLDVLIGGLLEPAMTPGAPVQITKESAKRIENAEVRGMAEILLAASSGTRLSAAELGLAIAEAAVETYYISESDSQPTFCSADWPTRKALSGENVMAAFSEHLTAAFEAEGNGGLSSYTIEGRGPARSLAFLHRLTEGATSEDEYVAQNARGFARLEKLLRENLEDIRVFRVGPKDEDGSLAADSGAYRYLIVGKTQDGKLAGISFESVET